RALQAGLPPNPTIGYVASEIGAEGTAGQQGAFVSQEFVRGGKLQLARSAELRGVVRAQQQFEMQRRRVLNDVRAEFYRALVAQRIVELSTQLVHIGQQNFETAEKLLRAQERTRI